MYVLHGLTDGTAGLRFHQCHIGSGCGFRRSANRDAPIKLTFGELHNPLCPRATVDRCGEGGAAGVGDVGAAEEEHLELRQTSYRQR